MYSVVFRINSRFIYLFYFSTVGQIVQIVQSRWTTWTTWTSLVHSSPGVSGLGTSCQETPETGNIVQRVHWRQTLPERLDQVPSLLMWASGLASTTALFRLFSVTTLPELPSTGTCSWATLSHRKDRIYKQAAEFLDWANPKEEEEGYSAFKYMR